MPRRLRVDAQIRIENASRAPGGWYDVTIATEEYAEKSKTERDDFGLDLSPLAKYIGLVEDDSFLLYVARKRQDGRIRRKRKTIARLGRRKAYDFFYCI